MCVYEVVVVIDGKGGKNETKEEVKEEAMTVAVLELGREGIRGWRKHVVYLCV